MILESGSVTIETYPEKAPNHVKELKNLQNPGFTMVLLSIEL